MVGTAVWWWIIPVIMIVFMLIMMTIFSRQSMDFTFTGHRYFHLRRVAIPAHGSLGAARPQTGYDDLDFLSSQRGHPYLGSR